MNGLIETLKNGGALNIASQLNDSEKKVSIQIIKWVKNETGIDLFNSGPNGENLTQPQLNKLKDADLKFSIRFTPSTFSPVDTFVKLVGPFSGLMIVIFCIMLDTYIIYTIFNAPSIIQGLQNINAFVTLVTGYYHAKAGEIISYWFGASSQNPITPPTPTINTITSNPTPINIVTPSGSGGSNTTTGTPMPPITDDELQNLPTPPTSN